MSWGGLTVAETINLFKLLNQPNAVVYIDGAKIIGRNSLGEEIARGVAGTDDSTVVQTVIDTLDNNEALVTTGDFVLTSSLTVLKKIKWTHRGQLLASGNISAIKIGNNATTVQKGLEIDIFEITGQAKTGGKAFEIINCAQNRIRVGRITTIQYGFYFSAAAGAGAFTNDNFIEVSNAGEMQYYVYFEGSATCPLQEGNEFRQNCFTCDHGIYISANTRAGFTVVNGVIDNADVAASKDFENNSSNQGCLLLVKFIREDECVLQANDILTVLSGAPAIKAPRFRTVNFVFKELDSDVIALRDSTDANYKIWRADRIDLNRLADINGVDLLSFAAGGLTLADGKNIATNTATGSKIGTAANQKIGFWGVAPVAQPAANADTSGATLPQLETEVNEIKALLRTVGLMAT